MNAYERDLLAQRGPEWWDLNQIKTVADLTGERRGHPHLFMDALDRSMSTALVPSAGLFSALTAAVFGFGTGGSVTVAAVSALIAVLTVISGVVAVLWSDAASAERDRVDLSKRVLAANPELQRVVDIAPTMRDDLDRRELEAHLTGEALPAAKHAAIERHVSAAQTARDRIRRRLDAGPVIEGDTGDVQDVTPTTRNGGHHR